jgi:YVTN family beta-propeller protein
MARGLQPRVSLLGRVSLETGGGAIDEARFPGRQGRLVFAYLVAERGRAVPRDELAEALWGDAPPPTWDKALTGVVSRLRALLSDQGVDGASALTAAFGCYRLELPEGTWVDVLAAVTAADEAAAALAAGDLDKAKHDAALAESLLLEPFLPGEAGTWVENKRRELADVRGRALGVLTDASLRSDDPEEAVKWAEQAIALEPFRETGYRRLMEARIAAGDRAEALRVYERCRQLLADELGAYPSPETESIYRGLLEAPRDAPRTTTVAEPRPQALVPDRPAPRPERRRVAPVLVAVALGAASAIGAAVVLLTRASTGPALAGISTDSIGIFRPGESRPSGQIPIGSSPGAVTAGDGSVWVANADAHSVSRIDPIRQVVIDRIQVGHGPAGIAFGAGSVWIANGLDGSVWRIDPKTDTVVQRIQVGNGPAGIAVGAGKVWVANADDGTVTPIDLPTGRPLRPLPVGRSADGVAVGGGFVWVTSQAEGTVTKIDPRSLTVVARKDSGSGADAVAIGPGGVWVANSLDGTVTRIDPVTDSVRATIPVGDGPNGIAVVDGAVWVSNELGGTLTKVDPVRGVPDGTVTVGNRPAGIVGSRGALFVPVRASGAGHQGGTLTLLTSSGDLAYLDPADAYSQTEWPIISITNDGLVGYRRVGGSAGTKLVPDLAVSLPVPTDGGRTYTFHLRPGIRYSTGAVVRPADFRRAVERSLRHLQGPGFWLAGIVGAKRCLARPKEPCDLSRGIVTDPAADTVTFHLTAPDADFLYKLQLPVAYAVPAGTPLHLHGFAPATGPYEIAWFDPKRGIRLVRNPRFREWSAAAQPSGFPNEIVERVTGSPDAHIAAVLHGSADLASIGLNAGRPSPGVLASVRTEHASQLELDPWNITWYLALNTRTAPFDSVVAHRAFNLAVDRRRLRDLTIGPALGQVTCQVLPPNLSGYRRYCPYTAEPDPAGGWTAPDPELARRLVRSSGTARRSVMVEIPSYLQWSAAAGRYLVSVLDSLGYNARYRFVPGYLCDERKQQVQVCLEGWYPDYASPTAFIDPLLTCAAYKPTSSGNLNLAEFCDRRIDREIARARSLQTSDPGTASRLWTTIDRDLTDRAPWLAFANGVVLEVKSTRVGNYQNNPQWGTLLDQLWVR